VTSNEEQENVSRRGDCDTCTHQDDDHNDQSAVNTTDSIVVHLLKVRYLGKSDKELIKWVVEDGLGLDFSQYVEGKEIERIGQKKPARPIRVKIQTVEKRREIMRRVKETQIEQQQCFGGLYIHNYLTHPQLQKVHDDLQQKLKKFQEKEGHRHKNVVIKKWRVEDGNGNILYVPDILVSEYY